MGKNVNKSIGIDVTHELNDKTLKAENSLERLKCFNPVYCRLENTKLAHFFREDFRSFSSSDSR